MKRRMFIGAAAAGLLAFNGVAVAQNATRVRRLAFLSIGKSPTAAESAESLAPLRALGWIEGQNLAVERRYANLDFDRLSSMADELVRLKVDVIRTVGTTATLAATKATATIPIVFVASDPVGMGLVASLARPGGNVTGYSNTNGALASKRAQLLHECLPDVRRVAVLIDSRTSINRRLGEFAQAAYRSLGLTPVVIEADATVSQDDEFFRTMRQRAQALDMSIFPGSEQIVIMAARQQLPAVVGDRTMLEAGGLLMFSFDNTDLPQRVAAIIDKILRGARPGDIPVEEPTRFSMGINLKTAKALGIVVPKALLLRADEVVG